MSDVVDSLFRGVGSAINAFSEGIKKNVFDIQVPSVLTALGELEMKKNHYTSEKHVEKVLVEHLNEKVGRAHAQYNISGYLGLTVDIDLGNGQIGVELKLAKELIGNASAIERLFGQVIYYSKRQYRDRLIVVVVGTDKEHNEVIKEIEKFIGEVGVYFKYITVK
jgi:hypothetical protein